MKAFAKIIFGLFFLAYGEMLCSEMLLADESFSPDSTRSQLVQAILSSGDEQKNLIQQLATADDSAVVRETLMQWRTGGLYLHIDASGTKIPFLLVNDQPVRVDNGQALEISPANPLETTPLDTDSTLRRAISSTLSLLALTTPDPNQRRSAVMKLGMMQRAEYLPIFAQRLTKETDARVIRSLHEAIAITQLADPSVDQQIGAIKKLGALNSISSLDLIRKYAADASEPTRQNAAQQTVRSLESYLFWIDLFGTMFRGLSLGSVLLIASLGLAITFGLMGVINMAHGELIAVGAYSSYVMEGWFSTAFGSSGLEYYFIFAIPFAFINAALVGLILERTVIRFLYQRPLESLLATWGVSLVLQQLFRFIFGANNVAVDSPSWMLGNFTISDVTLGYNRLFVIAFSGAIILLTWSLLTKTPLGLLIRAVMQNREMASCVGVRTQQVNMLTFAFGSGLAGLAGAFLSQIGNVGPSLGQNYIIDCFMTVVVGGVGNIIGTICSAFSIGIADQTLQQILQNPVLGKITVLIAIIAFLQWKPGGLFPTKGRGLED